MKSFKEVFKVGQLETACCFSLSVGAALIAVLHIIGWLVTLAYSISEVSWRSSGHGHLHDNSTHPMPNFNFTLPFNSSTFDYEDFIEEVEGSVSTIYEFASYVNYFLLFWGPLNLLAGGLLLAGVHRRDHRMVVPFIVLTVLDEIGGGIIAFIFLTIFPDPALAILRKGYDLNSGELVHVSVLLYMPENFRMSINIICIFLHAVSGACWRRSACGCTSATASTASTASARMRPQSGRRLSSAWTKCRNSMKPTVEDKIETKSIF